MSAEKAAIYQRVTDRIVADLEAGVRPWFKPWNAEHAAGRITRPLRWNGQPYSGINVVMLWSEAVERGYAAPIWMTFKQVIELGAHVRKGERGSLVVYADRIVRAEIDAKTGEETERQIPFMKGYTVLNIEQIDGLPDHYYAKAEATLDSVQRIAHAEEFFAATEPKSGMVATGLTTAWRSTMCRCPRSRRSAMRRATTRRLRMRRRTGRGTRRGLTATLAASALAMKATQSRSWLPSLDQLSCVPIWR
jgi:hypothetical protein